MIAFKAHFDGEKIVLPDDFRGAAPREVIVVFEGSTDAMSENERQLWQRAQEASFAQVWENEEDAVYDSL